MNIKIKKSNFAWVRTHDYVHARASPQPLHYQCCGKMVDSDSIYHDLLFYLEVGVNLVTYVRRRTSSAPRPRHDVAGPCINVDLCEAEVCSEASLGGADVAEHSCQIEKQPAT